MSALHRWRAFALARRSQAVAAPLPAPLTSQLGPLLNCPAAPPRRTTSWLAHPPCSQPHNSSNLPPPSLPGCSVTSCRSRWLPPPRRRPRWWTRCFRQGGWLLHVPGFAFCNVIALPLGSRALYALELQLSTLLGSNLILFLPSAPQLSNVEVITAYLFGKQDSGKLLPVAKQLDEELSGGWLVLLIRVVYLVQFIVQAAACGQAARRGAVRWV